MENSKLYEALAKAQGEMGNAKFNKMNPHFKNKYADLSSIMDVCKKPLSDNGLSILQIIKTCEEGKMYLITRLAHSSGQYIESSFVLKNERNTIQGLGSSITYARRYSLSAMLGIVADEDDDGEAAVKENDKFIDNVQVATLSKKINELSSEDKIMVVKAIGEKKLSDIKKDKYKNILKLIESTVKKYDK